MVANFKISSSPEIIFGSGQIKRLPELIERFGNNVLLITGKSSFVQSEYWDKLLLQFEAARIHWKQFSIAQEPSPAIIDECVDLFEGEILDLVISIGGGSVLDAGKAISAMLCQKGSVIDYLEGVGSKGPSGKKIPFIAVPTTAGTGSETTKNAVISMVGNKGFKKSIRHDNYVPDIALIDPQLTLNCPKSLTAESGMDAFTQLMESYLSENANAFTDALAVDGIRKIRDGLVEAVDDGKNLHARELVSYAAMLSGITLANAGLGTIHGFASSIGGFFEIPHGLICARMMEPVNRISVDKLRKNPKDQSALLKYARIGKLFSKNKSAKDDHYIDLFLDLLEDWSSKFELKRLKNYGVKENDFKMIISQTSNKFNPVKLTEDELRESLIGAF